MLYQLSERKIGSQSSNCNNLFYKVWETRLSFKVSRLSVGQGVRQKEPKVTEPKVTEPKVTEPKVTEPKVTEPKVTEPKVTEPQVTEPKVTKPQATPVPTDAPTEASQRVPQGIPITETSFPHFPLPIINHDINSTSLSSDILTPSGRFVTRYSTTLHVTVICNTLQ